VSVLFSIPPHDATLKEGGRREEGSQVKAAMCRRLVGLQRVENNGNSKISGVSETFSLVHERRTTRSIGWPGNLALLRTSRGRGTFNQFVSSGFDTRALRNGW